MRFDEVALDDQALLIAALIAVHPQGLGGVVLRGGAGPMRDAWLSHMQALLPTGVPFKRIPLHISDERLLGGMDLAATLGAGKPVLQQGVLSQADSGVVVLAMAERVAAHTAACLCAALDRGEVTVARDGLHLSLPARIALIALDESEADAPEQLSAALKDRLAFEINTDTGHRYISDMPDYIGDDIYHYTSIGVARLNTARLKLAHLQVSDEVLQALCAAALALGVASLRASQLTLNAAIALAALRDADEVSTADVACAAQLVLSHRATQLPVSEDAAPPDQDEQAQQEPGAEDDRQSDNQSDNQDNEQSDSEDKDSPRVPDEPLDDVVLEAAKAAIPAGLLAQLQAIAANNQRAQAAASNGKAGALQHSKSRGRPIGARRGIPHGGMRLNVIETLRAAAPWQRLRQAAAMDSTATHTNQRIQIRKDDFHITRLKQRSDTTTVFVVDASGSSALHRLAEAKGAVELLLADCYVRRDRVAMIAFRGAKAELLLPPTRSLVRAKRSLAALPGGGGTPLAAAIDGARDITQSLQRQGSTPVLVFLTDGKGNIARDGTPGRVLAAEQSLQAARMLGQQRVRSVLIDTSREPQDAAQALAQAMGAQYLPLPYADAKRMSQAILATTT